MPSLRRLIRPELLAVAVIALASSACDKPTLAEGNTAAVGGIEFTIESPQTRYLEVTEGSNTYEYPQPAIAIPVTLKNVGEGEFTYNPTHATQQMTEAQTPLLYLDPGAEEKLPPESKNLINGVYLEKGALEGQQRGNTTIKQGESLTDLFLFEVPEASANKLVLSVPPSMHRGKFPVLFRINYAPTEAKGPAVHNVGDAVSFNNAEFTITGTEIAYVKTTDPSQGEGFSSEPLLKIAYRIKNTTAEPISYDPSHRDVGGRGASLFGKDQTYKRVKFSASTTVEGQKEATQKIEPGATVEDFVLFERPAADAGQLNFEYPAALFSGSGIARVRIDYEHADPPLPKELKKKDAPASAEDEKEKGG